MVWRNWAPKIVSGNCSDYNLDLTSIYVASWNLALSGGFGQVAKAFCLVKADEVEVDCYLKLVQ